MLDEMTMPLNQVLGFQVGSQVILNATPHSRVTLTCGDIPTYLGRMGCKGASIAIRIEEQVKSRKIVP
ncbi:MAG: flagellar motor switch protein FliM [Rhodospirillaceae bacterium]|nr:MAG: flagellar motor switch protein FliM [Rhodospirillaceae bacterium]